mgnify:FL=1
MFSKKKVYIYIFVLLIVVFLDFWIFSNIKSTFVKITNDNNKNIVTLIDTVHSETDYNKWVKDISAKYENLSIIYLNGVPGFDDLVTYAGSEESLEFYQENSESKDFQNGLEYASYSEIINHRINLYMTGKI